MRTMCHHYYHDLFFVAHCCTIYRPFAQSRTLILALPLLKERTTLYGLMAILRFICFCHMFEFSLLDAHKNAHEFGRGKELWGLEQKRQRLQQQQQQQQQPPQQQSATTVMVN